MNKPETAAQIPTEIIRIRGQVQGVGFRPTVYRIARQLNLCGEVMNDGIGVKVILQAESFLVDQFIEQIKLQCPPLARIDSMEREELDESAHYSNFSISSSRSGAIQTGIIPDAATCSDCLQDIRNPQNRRAGYAFTNCTHCGPRLSIVQQIPYDRSHTSMKSFRLCEPCQQEYDDPDDRRFHAQPNACPDCGPSLTMTDAQGNALPGEDILHSAAELIRQGHILAIKGIGGFQLACDAQNDEAVKQLRQRKRRPAKAFALMASSSAQIRQYCAVSAPEQQLLESSAAPIVILQILRDTRELSPAIAPGQHALGFMLPYSPLHHLLLQQLETPIVLTSGNAADEPQCTNNQQAIRQLGSIADFFILHNRDIVNRIDDSVLRIIGGHPHYYRRARGYAPAPLPLNAGLQNNRNILALGAEMKNTFCLLKDRQLTLSQHIGNLENAQTYADYLKHIALYQNLYDFQPDVIAVDRHPEYLSSKLGRMWAAEQQIPLLEIQHHHAHIAACLVDNAWPAQQGPVIGVALDGLGYGDDGSVWGGEFLLADFNRYTRYACLKPVALPGASKAITEPWRNTYAQLTQQSGWQEIAEQYPALALVQFLQQQPITLLDQMIRQRLNSPMSSSCGRLFDAIAAALGICAQRISYEGQAALELEALITPNTLAQATPYPFQILPGEPAHIDTSALWPALLNDLQNATDPALISARFHVTLAAIILQIAQAIRLISRIDTVALSGGVFQNATLLGLTVDRLTRHSFRVLSHRQVPANDGGLALGQAAIAAARIQSGELTL